MAEDDREEAVNSGEASESDVGPVAELDLDSELGPESEDSATDEDRDLADLDPNAEKAARTVERQLRRLQREL